MIRARSIVAAVVVAAGMAWGQAATGSEAGPYFSFGAGVNLAQDTDAELDFGFFTSEGELEFDPGFRISFAPGYNFNRWLGAELESGFLFNSLDKTDDWVGHVPFLVNLIFRFENETGLTPYIGAGGGGAATFFNIDEVDTDTDVVFAWQGLAGIHYAIAENVSIGLGYKYFSTGSSQFEIEGVGIELEETHSHAIMFGADFAF